MLGLMTVFGDVIGGDEVVAVEDGEEFDICNCPIDLRGDRSCEGKLGSIV